MISFKSKDGITFKVDDPLVYTDSNSNLYYAFPDIVFANTKMAKHLGINNIYIIY